MKKYTEDFQNVINYIEKNKYSSMKALVHEARRNHIEVTLLSEEEKLIKISKNRRSVYIYKTNIPFKRKYSNLSKNKSATKKILSDNNISTAKGFVVSNLAQMDKAFSSKNLQPPLIVKPLDASRALGVIRNITSKEALKKSFKESKKESKSKKIIIEEMFSGDEYRILVLKNKVISCAQKIPATITGDGKSTIQELIDIYNNNRLDGFKILVDNKRIREKKYTKKSILPKNEELQLNESFFMRDGARCIERLGDMPQKIIKSCEKASKVLGMDYVGFDLIKKCDDSNYIILEANPCPAHIINEPPLIEGSKKNISKMLLQYFFKI